MFNNKPLLPPPVQDRSRQPQARSNSLSIATSAGLARRGPAQSSSSQQDPLSTQTAIALSSPISMSISQAANPAANINPKDSRPTIPDFSLESADLVWWRLSDLKEPLIVAPLRTSCPHGTFVLLQTTLDDLKALEKKVFPMVWWWPFMWSYIPETHTLAHSTDSRATRAFTEHVDMAAAQLPTLAGAIWDQLWVDMKSPAKMKTLNTAQYRFVTQRMHRDLVIHADNLNRRVSSRWQTFIQTVVVIIVLLGALAVGMYLKDAFSGVNTSIAGVSCVVLVGVIKAQAPFVLDSRGLAEWHLAVKNVVQAAMWVAWEWQQLDLVLADVTVGGGGIQDSVTIPSHTTDLAATSAEAETAMPDAASTSAEAPAMQTEAAATGPLMFASHEPAATDLYRRAAGRWEPRPRMVKVEEKKKKGEEPVVMV
ncbi:hypothetical protein FB45DRAFT_1068264 [Roridomyces roridus]|uniref:Uncharacterized protein n=1 Tax=Roridomyces roridus TaxID=1738132 RepID=A0AAD7F9D7_9AGAR|nr:hypothetical protein FB45DRAFT_1068264 [Roridomyces roridus]